jgi:hypothetical protein
VSAVDACGRQPKTTFGGTDEEVDIIAVFARKRFVALKSEQAGKIGVSFGELLGRSGFPGAAFSFSQHAAPPNGSMAASISLRSRRTRRLPERYAVSLPSATIALIVRSVTWRYSAASAIFTYRRRASAFDISGVLRHRYDDAQPRLGDGSAIGAQQKYYRSEAGILAHNTPS